MFKWDEIVLATRNEGKVREFTQWFEPLGIKVRSAAEFPDAPEVEEDGVTFEQNAVKKAETISRSLGKPALADDSGLEVDALGGRPGVYSARFAGPDATQEENNRKLIESMRDVPPGERTARFRCVLALAVPGGLTLTAEGSCEGEITLEPRGTEGFGYDPLFFLPEKGKTMAELDREEKTRISHRGEALENLREKLLQVYGGAG